MVLAQNDRIEMSDLSPNIREGLGEFGGPSVKLDLPETALTVKDAEKQLVVRALEEANGNRTLAAKKIGISRRTLHRKLHAYHLEGN